MAADPSISSWFGADQCIVNGVATLACLPSFFENIMKVAVAFGGAVAVFFIVWGGYKMVRSGGDPKQVEGARQTITYAIIGLILVFMSYFIIVFIATLTGVDCIKKFGFDQCRADTNATATDAQSTNTCQSDVNFSAAQIPANSCTCADGATIQFGECDTDEKPSCPYNIPFGQLDQTAYPPGSCSCPSDSTLVGSGSTGYCQKNTP